MINRLKNIPFLKNGKPAKSDIVIYSRGGTLSPELICLEQNGRLITPFEQCLRGWEYTFETFLSIHIPYELLEKEFEKRDWLFKRVGQNDDWQGATLVVPFSLQSP